MKPGRDLDALVAEKVMGWRPVKFVDGIDDFHGRDPSGDSRQIPPYSTDIAAAWQVVEKLRSTNPLRVFNLTSLEKPPQWSAAFYTYNGGPKADCDYHYAPTAPLAICLAALKAVGPL